jgi:hypothetical protein
MDKTLNMLSFSLPLAPLMTEVEFGHQWARTRAACQGIDKTYVSLPLRAFALPFRRAPHQPSATPDSHE